VVFIYSLLHKEFAI